MPNSERFFVLTTAKDVIFRKLFLITPNPEDPEGQIFLNPIKEAARKTTLETIQILDTLVKINAVDIRYFGVKKPQILAFCGCNSFQLLHNLLP
jgi:hypothetical protein